MGKGDKKSRKGKIFQGSYGLTRPRKAKKYSPTATVEGAAVKATTEKKGAAKKSKAAKKED